MFPSKIESSSLFPVFYVLFFNFLSFFSLKKWRFENKETLKITLKCTFFETSSHQKGNGQGVCEIYKFAAIKGTTSEVVAVMAVEKEEMVTKWEVRGGENLNYLMGKNECNLKEE